MSAIVAGVDLGGTGSRFVVCKAGDVIASRTIGTAEFSRIASVGERLDQFAATIRALLPPWDALAAVGIGASGPVDIAAGVVRNADTLPAFSGFELVQGVEDRLGVPIAIDNDAVTAAVAEHRFGAGAGARRMLMVTLGTGIGAALLCDGLPFRGLDGVHPEAGHIPINGASGRCYCGAEGCWEMAASRSALQRRLRAVLPSDIADHDLVDTAQARADRPEIEDALRQYGRLFGQGLSVLHTVYAPDVTVVGGSAARAFASFQPGLREALARAPGFTVPAVVKVALLGDKAGALGAAQLALEMAVNKRGSPHEFA